MFDIEEQSMLIPEIKTRELFKEVYSSYQHANYRSAIVLLWSVVIADVIFKLQFLKNAYQNKQAEVILQGIEKQQKANPTSSDWEREILQKACNELQFITPYEREHLEYLHKQRNASAHPILTDNNLLLIPNRDTTRSLIRNAMEAILLKPALINSKLVNSFVEDLGNIPRLLRPLG